MKEGDSSIIEYLGWDGSQRYARLLPTDVHLKGSPLQNVDDPLWIFGVNGRENNAEWLEYLTGDGTRWKAKTHCHWKYPDGYIYTRLEHVRDDGVEGDPEADGLVFMGWDRIAYRGQILNVYSFPGQPIFRVRRHI